MTNPADQFRPAFERACYVYYQGLKAAGWSAPGEGDNTPESLFWRRDNGMYGVHSIEAAWNGFMMAVQTYVPTLNAYVDLVQRASTPAGLLAGDDIPQKLVPRIEAMAQGIGRLSQALGSPAVMIKDGDCFTPTIDMACERLIIANDLATGSWISAEDVDRLVMDIEVALNGKEAAAKSPRLCDVTCQIEAEARKLGQPLVPAIERLAECRSVLHALDEGGALWPLALQERVQAALKD